MKYKTRDKDYTNWPDWAIEADQAGKQVYGKAWDVVYDALVGSKRENKTEGYFITIENDDVDYKYVVKNITTGFVHIYDHFEPTEEKPKKYRVKSMKDLIKLFIKNSYEINEKGFIKLTSDQDLIFGFRKEMFDYCGKDVEVVVNNKDLYAMSCCDYFFIDDWVEEYEED